MGKWSGFVAVARFCVVVAFIFIAAGSGYGEIMLDRVVAVVNSEVITWSELYQSMEFEATPEIKALSDQDRRKVFKENEAAFLENLINTKLILQAAKTARVGAGEAEINQTINDIKAKHKMSDEDFNKAITKEGFTLKEYKKKLAEQLIAAKLIDIEVRRKVVVTDKEINDFLLRNKDAADQGYVISLVLVRWGENPKAAEARIAEAYEKLKGGASFAEVARKYSDDSSARQGGDKGFVRRADLSNEIVDVISNLKKGEMSQPFRTTAGMNIIKLEDSRIYSKDSELKAAVKERLYSAKYGRAYRAWIKGLRQTAYVEIR